MMRPTVGASANHAPGSCESMRLPSPKFTKAWQFITSQVSGDRPLVVDDASEETDATPSDDLPSVAYRRGCAANMPILHGSVHCQ